MKKLIFFRKLFAVVIYVSSIFTSIQVMAMDESSGKHLPQIKEKPNRNAEGWVLSQLMAGKRADLSDFDRTEKPVLSAAFLEGLPDRLKDNALVSRRGISIDNAVIVGPVNFSNMDIPYKVSFYNFDFKEDVDFSYGNFKELFFADSRFDGRSHFNGLKADVIYLGEVVFNGDASFRSVNISDEFHISSAIFKGGATFDHMEIGGECHLFGAEFAGGVSFFQLFVGGILYAEEVNFVNSSPSFNGLEVGGDAFFTSTSFAKGGSFKQAHIKGNFNLSSTQISDYFDLRKIEVGHEASFNGIEVKDKALLNFSDADFSSISFDLKENLPISFELAGMTYRVIHVTDEKILELFQRASFNASNYVYLEDYFQKSGYPDKAKTAFVARKDRERQNMDEWSWLWSTVFKYLACYGKCPFRIVGWSFLIVFVGMCIFRKKNMVPENFTEIGLQQNYNSFWYSFDLFLPISLRYEGKWIPKNECRIALLWMRIHIIFGWLLVPIATLAFAGVFK